MSLEHNSARQGDVGAYTIPHFCSAHGISRSLLYKMWAEGRGPRWMAAGTRRLISVEAAERWRRQMEAEAQE